MTLTETGRLFRLGVKLFSAIMGGLIALRVVIVVVGLVFPETPPEPEKPVYEAAFGKIPPLIVDISQIQLANNYTAQLDVLQESLPTEPQVAPIYPILKAPYGFLSEDRAKELASAFSLKDEPTKASAVELLWRAPNQALTVNVQNLNFLYQYKYNLDPSVFVPGIFTNQSDLIKTATELQGAYNIYGAYANDISQTTPKVWLLKYQNQKLQPVTRIAEASAARVDFSRNSVVIGQSNYPFVSPDYIGSITNTLFALRNNQLGPIEVKFILWRYRTDQGSNYPMVSSQIAWENIQLDPSKFTVYLGNLALGPLDRNTSIPVVSSIVVKQVYFAYYNTEREQDYIQPVWVFIGKATLATGGNLDWVAYVPAVDPNYVTLE